MANTIRCGSSHLMSGLLSWRIPEDPMPVPRGLELFGKKIVTEFALIGLATTAIVETVVYSILTGLSLALYPITNRPYKFCAKLLDSSSFTIIWTLANALLYNLATTFVAKYESLARLRAQESTGIKFLRVEDLSGSVVRYNLLMAKKLPEVLIQGTQFLVESVLKDLPESDIAEFKENSADIYNFILARAIFIYVAGDKKSEEIPYFFKVETRTAIEAMRRAVGSDEDVTAGLISLVCSKTMFDRDTPEVDLNIQVPFRDLRTIASGELQGQFARVCFSEAVQLLNY